MPKPLNSGSATPERVENAVCPFCSLLCDDLSLSVAGDTIKILKNACAQSKSGFERPRTASHPLIAGKRASQRAALEEAARLLKRSARPLISGLGTDVEGMREAVHLAEKSKAIIDHADSSGFDSGLRVLQSRGWYMTTLAEVRNRADLIIIVGADVVERYGNFLRRYVAPKQALQPQRRKDRRVVYVGTKAAAPASTRDYDVEVIGCDPPRIAEVVGALRALAAGRSVRSKNVAGASAKQLAGLAAAITAAAYPVFVWAPSHIEGGQADLAIHAITRLIDDLNQTQRAAGLALGGDNGGMSAANVCAWLTGYPLHVSFAGKTLEYDPVRYRTRALLDDRTIDTLVWIDAFGLTPPPPQQPGMKHIVIGAGSTEHATNADVFLPAGTPGVDHRGRLVRTDSVVSMQLDQLRQRSAPSVRKIVHEILEHL